MNIILCFLPLFFSIGERALNANSSSDSIRTSNKNFVINSIAEKKVKNEGNKKSERKYLYSNGD